MSRVHRFPKRITLAAIYEATEKPADGCWIWPSATNGAGRGVYKGRSAPRQIYEMLFGPIDRKLGVLHRCDNPVCVRPDHLWVGGQHENMKDCSSKGRRSLKSRQPPGEQHSLAKLTNEDVRYIRNRAAAGVEGRQLARAFFVSTSQISRIVNRQRWATLDD